MLEDDVMAMQDKGLLQIFKPLTILEDNL